MGHSRRGRIRAPDLTGRGSWINTKRNLSLRALKGKVVLLDFWTFCCINCLHVLEELRPLEARFGDGLVVIGVHSPKFEHERDHEVLKHAVPATMCVTPCSTSRTAPPGTSTASAPDPPSSS